MSEASRAWSWRHAFASSDLAATTKAVLHTLGMFMNDLGEGCYPSVADICRYSGLDKKTVLKHLAAARDAGWIAVAQHGYRGQKWKRNEYAARWPERDMVAPCLPDAEPERGGATPPPSGDGKAVDLVPEGGGTEGSKVVEQVHQDKTSPETTPVTSPIEREARARERTEEPPIAEPPIAEPDAGDAPGDDQRGEEQSADDRPADDQPGRAAFDKRVMRFCSGRGFLAGPWPDWDTSSPDWIARQFAALSSAERREAERWRDAYLLDVADRKKAPLAPGNWLRGKVWTGLQPALLERAEKLRQGSLPAEERARPDGWAKCLGPVGMARFFALLIEGEGQGRRVSRLMPRAELQRQWPALLTFCDLLRQKGGAVFGPRWHALDGAMEPVPAGTELSARWKAEFEARGWLWLDEFDRLKVVFCPVSHSGDVAGALTAFGERLRGSAEGREPRRQEENEDHDANRPQAAE